MFVIILALSFWLRWWSFYYHCLIRVVAPIKPLLGALVTIGGGQVAATLGEKHPFIEEK